jgi:hypothetical protein
VSRVDRGGTRRRPTTTSVEPMRRLSDGRRVGLLGIGWFVLFIVGAAVLQGEPPPAGAPVAQVRDFFHAAGRRYLVGDFVAGCAFMLLLLPFGVLLPRALSTVDRPAPWWSQLPGAGVVALVTVGGVATSFLDAVAAQHASRDPVQFRWPGPLQPHGIMGEVCRLGMAGAGAQRRRGGGDEE